MKDHSGVVRRFGKIQHGEVVDGAAGLDRVVGEGHVRRRQGLPVGESRVLPDVYRPGEAVAADYVIRRQVIADGEVRVGDRQGGLDQGLVDVLPRPPAEGRVKARGGLGIGVHGDDHGVRPLGGPFCRGSAGGGRSPAAGQGAGRQNGSQKDTDKVFSFHGTPHLRKSSCRSCPRASWRTAW